MRASIVAQIEAPPETQAVRIAPIGLEGLFARPAPGMGVVVFVHGSGSSRLSPRNAKVAAAVQKAGLGTLLFDLLLPDEAEDRANVFDIDLLARRLLVATAWLDEQDDMRHRPIGFFGASTGAAAALVAETYATRPLCAIVSRGGRPDLAGEALSRVRAPTLLIVGSEDHEVLRLNQAALNELSCEKEIAIVRGATHLFEEPGTLDMAVDLARRWFAARLSIPSQGRVRG